MNRQQARQLREQLGMTQDDMALYLGLRDKSQVSHLESGRTAIDGPVRRLLYILSVTGGELFPDISDKVTSEDDKVTR